MTVLADLVHAGTRCAPRRAYPRRASGAGGLDACGRAPGVDHERDGLVGIGARTHRARVATLRSRDDQHLRVLRQALDDEGAVGRGGGGPRRVPGSAHREGHAEERPRQPRRGVVGPVATGVVDLDAQVAPWTPGRVHHAADDPRAAPGAGIGRRRRSTLERGLPALGHRATVRVPGPRPGPRIAEERDQQHDPACDEDECSDRPGPSHAKSLPALRPSRGALDPTRPGSVESCGGPRWTNVPVRRQARRR